MFLSIKQKQICLFQCNISSCVKQIKPCIYIILVRQMVSLHMHLYGLINLLVWYEVLWMYLIEWRLLRMSVSINIFSTRINFCKNLGNIIFHTWMCWSCPKPGCLYTKWVLFPICIYPSKQKLHICHQITTIFRYLKVCIAMLQFISDFNQWSILYSVIIELYSYTEEEEFLQNKECFEENFKSQGNFHTTSHS